MKLYLLIGVVLAAAVGIVLSTNCHPHDLSQCDMNCTIAGEELGCEHDICTCKPAAGGPGHGQACDDKSDCADMHPHCDPHKQHCLDKHCACFDMHHGP